MKGDTLSRTVNTARRVFDEFTKQVTVVNFTYDDSAGSNAYADGDWVEDTQLVEATIRDADTSEKSKDAAGASVEHDTEVFVDPTEVDVTLGQEDETRATEFIEADTGRTYEAVGLHDESSLYRVECVEVDD